MPSVAQMIHLTGRRALVTGGGKGIGAAVAARLVEAGATVTIADLDPAAGDVAADVGASFVECDITDSAAVAGAVAAAAGDASLHILVNNAGIFPTTGPIADVTDDFVTRMLDVNVRAQFSLTREAVARMDQGGSIVNMSSITAIRGGGMVSAYAASKAALISLTRAAAGEFGGRGIRVNAVAPGVIDTPGVQDQLEPLRASGLDIDKVITSNLLGLAGEPDHIARVVLFLVSDLAAFVTGQTIVADAGATV